MCYKNFVLLHSENILNKNYRKCISFHNLEKASQRNIVQKSGIDVTFTIHCTRHARTSAALRIGVNIEVLGDAAGWTQSNVSICNKPVVAILSR